MPGKGAPVRIKCDQTGEIFKSVREASRVKKLLITELRLHLKNRQWVPDVGGLTFTKI